jgi:hypothetical protein
LLLGEGFDVSKVCFSEDDPSGVGGGQEGGLDRFSRSTLGFGARDSTAPVLSHNPRCYRDTFFARF